MREQLGFLQRSGELFDAGFRSEAKRIAVAIANLVHDTTRTTSLLTLLEKKGKVMFLDSSNHPIPLSYGGEHRLCGIRMYQKGKGSGFYPFLDKPLDKPRWMSFDEWWLTTVIKDKEDIKLTRKDLILDLRNRDGGAHIQSKLRLHYHALSRKNSIGLSFGNNDFEGPAEYGPQYASVRQIGFEVYMSLGLQLGDEIGWETPDIELAAPVFRLSGMPNGEVDATGERAVLSLAFENGEVMTFSCTTDALEVMLHNLEYLATTAYFRQIGTGTNREVPPGGLPEFRSHLSKFEICDPEDGGGYLMLKIHRGGRPPIVIAIHPDLSQKIAAILKAT